MRGRPKNAKNGIHHKIKRICKFCRKEFYVWPYKIKNKCGVYCSKKCQTKKNAKIQRICPICNKKFYVFPYIIKKFNRQYCSIQCVGKTKIGKKLSFQWKKNISKGNKGKKLSKSHIENSRKARIGLLSGSKHPNWQGGKSSERDRIKHTIKYKKWRKAIYTRDNYTCQLCSQKGGTLHAHHKKFFSKFPKLRFKISNGITLCKKCHNKIHSK